MKLTPTALAVRALDLSPWISVSQISHHCDILNKCPNSQWKDLAAGRCAKNRDQQLPGAQSLTLSQATMVCFVTLLSQGLSFFSSIIGSPP